MRILLTRPAAEAAKSADRLIEAGHQVILSPVTEMHVNDASWPSGTLDGVVATSAAAFDMARFAPQWPLPEVRRLLPIFVVGNKTAAAARRQGFTGELIAEANAKSLAEEIPRRVHPPARLVYLAGHDRKPDLETCCKKAAIKLTVVEVYEARAAHALSDEALHALGHREIDAVLHYSRRSAEIFLTLAAAMNIDAKRLRHLAISRDTATPLHSAACWYVSIASEPSEKALFALLPNS